MKSKSRRKMWIILGIVTGILLLLVFAGSRILRSFQDIDAGNMAIHTVERGNISYTAVGSGRISSSDVKTFVVPGSMTQSFVFVGDFVRSGDALCEYIEPQGQSRTLFSTREGVISGIQLSGMDGRASAVFEISSLDALQMVIQVAERQVFQIAPGMEAQVFVDALGAEVEGKVSRVSLLGKTVGDYAVFDVTVRLSNTHPDIYLGMTGSARILIETRTDVVKIPIDALIEKDGKTYVLTEQWLDNLRRDREDFYVEIETGLSDAFDVEVTQGDIAGLRILIPLRSVMQFPEFFR